MRYFSVSRSAGRYWKSCNLSFNNLTFQKAIVFSYYLLHNDMYHYWLPEITTFQLTNDLVL